MKLHLETNIIEGTPRELVEYLRLVEDGDKAKLPLFSFGHAHQPDEDTLKSLVGSLVKVADSYTGSTEEAEEILGYRYWYLEGTNFNKFVVLEASIDGYFIDSRGFRYTHKYVSKRIKPIDRENASKYFERSKDRGYLLKYYPTADVFTD